MPKVYFPILANVFEIFPKVKDFKKVRKNNDPDIPIRTLIVFAYISDSIPSCKGNM